MKCAECQKPMIKGFIPVFRQKLMWYPEEVRGMILFQPEVPGSINIVETPVFFREKKISYHCPRCNTILITQVVQNK